MKFKIKLITTVVAGTKPGDPGEPDQKIDRAEIALVDRHGQEDVQKVILEGEKVEVDVNIPRGAKIVIKELERPVVYNPETHAAEHMDLTPKDRLAPQPPNPAPKNPANASMEGGRPYDTSSLQTDANVQPKVGTRDEHKVDVRAAGPDTKHDTKAETPPTHKK